MGKWRAVVKEQLDRRAGRLLLAVLGSVWITVVRREPCIVRWRDGAWVHYFRGYAIPHRFVAGPLPLKEFLDGARRVYCYEYTPGLDEVVLDVGAGVGNATLLFSRLVGPSGRVIAVEAHPTTFGWLTHLCRLNGLANVTPIHAAASDVEGPVTISDLGADDQDRNTIVGDVGGISVRGRPLDAVARGVGVTHLDFLKMNIEGAEQLAIQGMSWLIARTEHVCIACHDAVAELPELDPRYATAGPISSDRMRTKDLVRQFLTEHGFRVIMNEDAADPWARDYLYGRRM
jgi:FkbM family methyltransferase